jgi:hypothetical protein
MKNDRQMFGILEHFSEATGVVISPTEIEAYKNEVNQAMEMSEAIYDPETREAEVSEMTSDITKVFLKHMDVAARHLPKGTFVLTCSGCNIMVTDDLRNCAVDARILGKGES